MYQKPTNLKGLVKLVEQPHRPVRQASVVHIKPALSQQRERNVSRGKIREERREVLEQKVINKFKQINKVTERPRQIFKRKNEGKKLQKIRKKRIKSGMYNDNY